MGNTIGKPKPAPEPQPSGTVGGKVSIPDGEIPEIAVPTNDDKDDE